MIINDKPKEVLQSYIITAAKYDFSIYEKRILYRIIEMLQDLTKGKKLSEKYEVSTDLFGDKIFKMPLVVFKKDSEASDKNHTQIKKAFVGLMSKIIEFNTKEGWRATSIIEKPSMSYYSETVGFRVDKEIFEAFLDFSKGYSKYEIKTAMAFDSQFAMRFYELLYNQKTPIDYTIENLKIMFSLENKYKNPADFIIKVVKKAKTELDTKSHFSFNYEVLKEGRRLHKVRFYPIKTNNPHPIPMQEADEVIHKHKLSLSSIIGNEAKNALLNKLEFTEDAIYTHLEKFEIAVKLYDLLDFINEISAAIREKEFNGERVNKIGYFINSLDKKNNQTLDKMGKLAQRNAFGGIDII